MSAQYQLTKHPIGSVREFWALTWPLMIGLLSASTMMFVSRLFLARYDVMALNATASGCIAQYLILVPIFGVAAISEVLAGRLHGEGECKKIGAVVWSMVLLVVFVTPLLWLLAHLLPNLLFYGSGNEANESAYFTMSIYFSPIQLLCVVLSGFFIAIGNVRIVTLATIAANIINVGLDYTLIFGMGSIPSMGITGAAIAAGLAQFAQLAMLLAVFLSPSYACEYQSRRIGIDFEKIKEALRIGAPSGFGHFMELVCHFLFLRMVMQVSPEQMSIVAMVQSVYILTSFIIESQSKAASAIVSNLLGGKAIEFIPKVLRAAFIQQMIVASLLFTIAIAFPDLLYKVFAADNQILIADGNQIFATSLLFMAVFFLFDGLSWILMGFLTAAGDTRYLMKVSIFVHWIAYIIPTVYLVYYLQGQADTAWGIIAAMSGLSFVLYFLRVQSGAYLKSNSLDQAQLSCS